MTQKQLAEMTDRAYEELGMTPDEFSSVLQQVFIEHDKNENGSLDPQEFEEAITSSGIQFSPKEKMMLLLAADENEDGDISYGEFAAVALQVILVVFLPSQRQRQTHSLTGGVSEGGRKEEGIGRMVCMCVQYTIHTARL